MVALLSKFPSSLNPEKTRKLVRYCGSNEYFKAKEEGRAVLLLTAHLGLWEYLAFAHGLLYKKFSFIVRPLNNPLLDQLLNRYRSLPGNNPIQKNRAVRKVLSLLARGEDVGILNDQNTKEEDGIFVDFFGKKATINIAFTAMALRSGAAVFPIFMVPDKEKKNRYCIYIFPELHLTKTGDKEKDIIENTIKITEALEKAIRKWPDRWLWMHKRWKTRPPGDTDNPYEGF